MNVKRHAYRFRFLNSSNQRFYRMTLSNGMPFTIIGDGRRLHPHARRRSPRSTWASRSASTRSSTSRASRWARRSSCRTSSSGSRRSARAPDPNTDGTVMQFTVVAGPTVPPKALPGTLNSIATLTPDRPTRFLIQNVQSDDAGPPAAGGARRPAVPHADHGAADDRLDGGLGVHQHHAAHAQQARPPDRVPGDPSGRPFDAARYLADWKRANGEPAVHAPDVAHRSGGRTSPAR